MTLSIDRTSRIREVLLLIGSILLPTLAGCSENVSSQNSIATKVGGEQSASDPTDELKQDPVETVSANPTTPQDPSPFRFTDIAPTSGVTFRHVSGTTAERHFPTANGSGVAVFDYDGDGLARPLLRHCN